MKSIFKKVSCLMLTALLLSSLCVPAAFAKSPATHAKETDITSLVQEDLQIQGSSIEEELNTLLQEYKRLSIVTSDACDKAKYNELASGVEAIIANYTAATNSRQINSVTSSNDSIHAMSVAAVLAYFSGHSYYLAGELLTRASMNKDESYIYTPTYASVVRNTNVVRDIVRSGMPYGSGEIKFSDSPDGYYAIHLFNYKKQGTRYVITDTYDYERGDQSYPDNISGVAVNAMAWAQEDGYLVPYTVWINC